MIKNSVQTGSEKGTYRRGDLHPTVPHRYFREYGMRNGKIQEAWMTEAAYQRMAGRKKADHERHKEERNKKNQAYAEENREAARERSRRHYYNSKADYIIRARNRETFIAQETEALSTRCKGVVAATYKASDRISKCLGISFHVDHIVPLSKGGTHAPSNLQIVPAKWNRRKKNLNNDLFPYNTSPA